MIITREIISTPYFLKYVTHLTNILNYFLVNMCQKFRERENNNVMYIINIPYFIIFYIMEYYLMYKEYIKTSIVGYIVYKIEIGLQNLDNWSK